MPQMPPTPPTPSNSAPTPLSDFVSTERLAALIQTALDEDLGPQRVKGIAEPVVVHRVVGLSRAGAGPAPRGRALVGRAHADGGELGGGAGIEGLGSAQGKEHVGVFGGEGGAEHALEGEDKVGGADRIAIRPTRLGAEVKGVA